jgi:hypothetical integral membrane protein (TIGR02206 family)
VTPLAAATRFEAFSGEHLVLLGIFVAGLVVAAAWGRAHRDTPLELPARRTAAVVLALVALGMQAYQLTPGDFDVDTSLPLALCDVATVMTVVALWTRSPRASAFTYYVGLTLTSQGVLTPSLAEGFPHPRYFGFWALHFLVVWAAAYLTWGLGIRPTWRRYRFAVGATLTWAVVVFAFNVVVDSNYGYLNAKPSSASLLDVLGPWPWYVVVEIVVVTVAWAVLLTLPWTLAARQRTREPLTASPRT